jgi:sphinganine-1-phosphate aldolase
MSQVPLSKFLNGTKFANEKTPSTVFFAGAAVAVALRVAFVTLRKGFFVKRVLDLKNRIIRFVFAPIVKREIEKNAKSLAIKGIEGELVHDYLPAEGYSDEKVIELCLQMHEEGDVDWENGGLSGTVYHGGRSHTALINSVMDIYQWTNPLHIDTFNAVRKMEAEVVQMVVNMFNGDKEACGALTSGGSESICMALKSYREWAREVKGITRPNVVMPVTAHPAFDKGCSYYGIDLIKVPVFAGTGRVDPALLETYITSDTIAIVGSAPNYPYGTVDPITELAAIAKRRGIGMHVDGCLGGFVVQFMAKAGVADAPVADFRVPGVTTISCDTHKFGYAPKGTSTVLYSNRDLRRYQYFTIADWPGGIYASPAAAGSKPGNCIAGTWAALISLGENGYTKAAADIQVTMRQIRNGLANIEHIQILGDPNVCAVGFTSSSVDIFVLNEKLCANGWQLNPLQFPSGIQFSLTLLHTRGDIADRFLAAVQKGVDELLAERKARQANGEPEPEIGISGSTMYGSQQQIADRSILADVAGRFIDSYYDVRHEVNKPKKVKK